MGGEKSVILTFASREQHSVYDWVKIFNLTDFESKVTEQCDLMFDDVKECDLMFDGFDDFEESCSSYDSTFAIDTDTMEVIHRGGNSRILYTLESFITEHDMIIFRRDISNWDILSIGVEVNDYDTVEESTKDKVDAFCEKYKLQKPTFIAGIVGEYE